MNPNTAVLAVKDAGNRMQDRPARTLHISIVSHGHGEDVAKLLDDLQCHAGGVNLSVILTLNLEEKHAFDERRFPFPLKVQANRQPQGFARNNNQAFRLAAPAADDFFCLINPDVRIRSQVFRPLIEGLERHPAAGVLAPAVLNSLGDMEDSARRLPTPLTILGKALGVREDAQAVGGDGCREVDWVAGLFMLFPAQAYAAVGGFDERYFLYYEDVDLCCRLGLAGYQVLWCPGTSVVHDARRDSHSNVRYSMWHLGSMARFFTSSVYRGRRRQLRAPESGAGRAG